MSAAKGLLDGRVAIVTGAGRGIGREIALLMAKEGARVVVNDLGASVGGAGQDGGPAQEVVNEITKAGGQAVANAGDVSSPSHVNELVESALSAFGALDIVVNNAGVLRKAKFNDISLDDWEAMLRVNLTSGFLMSQAATRVFQKQGHGSLIHMTSTAGLIGALEQAHYCTSKLAVAALSRSIALEMAADGIRSNCVSPIAFSRMMTAATGREPTDPANARQLEKEGVAAIAPLVVYLASDQARDINGQIIGARGNELYLYNQSRPIRVLQQSDGWTPQRIVEVLQPAWGSALVPLERTREVLSWPIA